STTICPLNVNACEMSTVVNPVTLTEDIDVNRASIKLIPPGMRLISGNISSPAPISAMVVMEMVNNQPGCTFVQGLKFFLRTTLLIRITKTYNWTKMIEKSVNSVNPSPLKIGS